MKSRTVYPIVVVPIVSIILIVALLVLYLSPFTHATPPARRIALANAASLYTSKSQIVSATSANQSISLAIGLNLRNQSNLASYLQQVTSPTSPLYRHYLNP
ncbi:MAG TPA: protease pro-enzyme activation domain-containing protein, partial [Ktedonobacteraceae bacterium]|nr:protease pro-enzyme activation domain-containing protein [Ktedonobacteraceae bacterium]